MRGWPVLVVVMLVLFGLVYRVDTADVFIYPTPDEIKLTDAQAGRLVRLEGSAVKLRGECIVRATHTDTIVTDSTGNSFIVNQRSGMVLRLPAGRHKIVLQFEVPRLAAAGPATVVFDNVYSCLLFEVRQATPEYAFEVLPDE